MWEGEVMKDKIKLYIEDCKKREDGNRKLAEETSDHLMLEHYTRLWQSASAQSYILNQLLKED